MKFHLTPAAHALVQINTAIAQARFRRESQTERLARVEARRFLEEPQALTGFGCLDPFRTDERAADALEVGL